MQPIIFILASDIYVLNILITLKYSLVKSSLCYEARLTGHIYHMERLGTKIRKSSGFIPERIIQFPTPLTHMEIGSSVFKFRSCNMATALSADVQALDSVRLSTETMVTTQKCVEIPNV